jgi:hypothetical protein
MVCRGRLQRVFKQTTSKRLQAYGSCMLHKCINEVNVTKVDNYNRFQLVLC